VLLLLLLPVCQFLLYVWYWCLSCANVDVLMLCADGWTAQDMLGQVKAEKRERAQLGSGAPYQRTIP
jgi:hypothetical protein